jgi:sugar/nucleoside kinase (ribokinase family)
VELLGPVAPEGGGVIVSLVDPAGERTMCSDRGVAPSLAPDEIEPAWFEGCAHLHVSGYALVRDPVRLAATRAVTEARAAGARISIDLSSWSAIRDFGAERFRSLLIDLGPDVVFANEDEERIVGGAIPCRRWIVKRGARGASFDGVEHDAAPVATVVDSTGAGDAFAAGWLVGGPSLALAAGARCVQIAGSMPEGCSLEPIAEA